MDIMSIVNKKTQNLKIRFTASQEGVHRICWKKSSDLNYNCNTTVYAKKDIISEGVVTFEYSDPGKENITIEGYVQPTCADVSDVGSQSPFNVQLTLNSRCTVYTLTCEKSGIKSVDISNGGTGYDSGNLPTISVSDATGSGATFNVTVAGGIITDVTVTNPGSDYTSPVLSVVTATTGSGAVVNPEMLTCEANGQFKDCFGILDDIPTIKHTETVDICVNANDAGSLVNPNPNVAVATNVRYCLETLETISVTNNSPQIVYGQYINLEGSVRNVTINANDSAMISDVVQNSFSIMNYDAITDPSLVIVVVS